MTDQEFKEQQYLRHVLLNGTVKIAGCLKEIENIVSSMLSAIKVSQEDYNEADRGVDQDRGE